MPEQMTKQDAIEYLLYMKHDVQAKSPIDIALDTAIEALKQIAIKPEVRHAEWDCIDDDGGVYRCSACGEEWYLEAGTPKENNMNYCPNCGADMREGGADNG